MDTSLVERAQHGDEGAFTSLAVAIGDRLHAVAHRILRDTDLAEDATQQALLNVWRDLPQLRDPARFEAWSYRLLVRACYAEAKREHRWAPNLRLLPTDEPMTTDALHSVADRDQLERGFRRLSGNVLVNGDSAIVIGSVIHGLFSDPCNAQYEEGLTDVTVGSTVDDLVNAFRAQTTYGTSLPMDVTLGDYSGPTDVDFAACNQGGFFIWDGSIYAQGPGDEWHLRILDVEGQRIVIFTQDFAATSDVVKTEARAIVNSLQIQP